VSFLCTFDFIGQALVQIGPSNHQDLSMLSSSMDKTFQVLANDSWGWLFLTIILTITLRDFQVLTFWSYYFLFCH